MGLDPAQQDVGQFRSPLVLVLVAAAGISHLLGEQMEAGVILVAPESGEFPRGL